MDSLRQPHLGQTILNLRQEKNLIQEELVELCHVSVRTIQRIEAGDVTPKDSTIRIILSALGYSFDKVKEEIINQSSIAQMSFGWIGIIYFVLAFVESLADYSRFDMDLPVYFSILYVMIKLLTLGAYVYFMLGFVGMGKIYYNSLKK